MISGDPSATRLKGSLALGSGVPGHELPRMRTATLDLRPGDVLVLATDGIGPAFADSLDISGSPQAISERIMAQYRKPTRRRSGGRGPLPRAAAVTAAARQRRGAPSEPSTPPLSRDYLLDRSERSLRVAYELGREAVQPAAERARPGRRPPGGPAVGAGRSVELGGVSGRDRGGRRFLSREPVLLRDGPAGIQRGTRDREARTPPDRDVTSAVDLPGRRLARPRRLRLARGDAAAGGRAGARARRGRLLRGHGGARTASRESPKPPPMPRPTGAGRRSFSGSTCSRSTGSSVTAAAR